MSLSADGKRVAIGANLNDASGNNSGHVRIYELQTEKKKIYEQPLAIGGLAIGGLAIGAWVYIYNKNKRVKKDIERIIV